MEGNRPITYKAMTRQNDQQKVDVYAPQGNYVGTVESEQEAENLAWEDAQIRYGPNISR